VWTSPQLAESILPAVTPADLDHSRRVLHARESELRLSQAARLRRVYRAI
jgi:hypothetical protein